MRGYQSCPARPRSGHGHVAAVVADTLIVGQQVYPARSRIRWSSCRPAGGQYGRALMARTSSSTTCSNGSTLLARCRSSLRKASVVRVQRVLHSVFQHLQLLLEHPGRTVRSRCGSPRPSSSRLTEWSLMRSKSADVDAEQGVDALAVSVVQLPAGKLHPVGPRASWY